MAGTTATRSRAGGARADRGPASRRRRAGLDRVERRRALLFLALPLLGLLLFYVTPSVLGLYYSFTDWSSYTGLDTKWVGLSQFRYLFGHQRLGPTMLRTVLFALSVTVIQNALGMALALLLRAPTRLNAVLRSVVFVPVVISPLAVGYLFRGALSQDGPVNRLLSTVVGHTVQVQWLGSTTFTLYVVAAVYAWHWFPISMVVFTAGLSSIPPALTEAAQVEGAGRWHIWRTITLPLLAPAVTFNVALTLVGALVSFDIIVATTSGGPGDATTVLTYFISQRFGFGDFGAAAAGNTVLFGMATVAIPVIVFLRRREVTL